MASNPTWRRAGNPYALALALLVHLVLLTLATRWQSPTAISKPPKPASSEVALLLPKVPPPPEARPQPAPAPAAPRPVELRTPTLPTQAPLQREAIAPLATSPTASLAQTEGLPAAPALVAAGSTAAATKAASGKLFEECADAPDRRMVAQVYRLRQGASSVLDMQGRQPLKTVCLTQLNITPRSFREGFPGMGDVVEWFGLDIRFTVDLPEAGSWDIMLLSDDGAILTIDDVEVINNDGIHAAVPLEATVRMAAGQRNFRVRYFQGPREGIALMLAWKRPGAADYQYLPLRLIGRPQAAS